MYYIKNDKYTILRMEFLIILAWIQVEIFCS